MTLVRHHFNTKLRELGSVNVALLVGSIHQQFLSLDSVAFKSMWYLNWVIGMGFTDSENLTSYIEPIACQMGHVQGKNIDA